MIGYLLKPDYSTSAIFYASWEELVEILAEMKDPKTSFTIDTCIYYKGYFKEKEND